MNRYECLLGNQKDIKPTVNYQGGSHCRKQLPLRAGGCKRKQPELLKRSNRKEELLRAETQTSERGSIGWLVSAGVPKTVRKMRLVF